MATAVLPVPGPMGQIRAHHHDENRHGRARSRSRGTGGALRFDARRGCRTSCRTSDVDPARFVAPHRRRRSYHLERPPVVTETLPPADTTDRPNGRRHAFAGAYLGWMFDGYE